MSKHTQGPWGVSRLGNAVISGSPVPEVRGSDEVDYYGGHLIAESVAAQNVMLIAAAPEMYDVCVQLVSARDSCDPPELKNAYFAALHIINKLKVQDNE